MFAPIESADRTSWSPRDHRWKESQRRTALLNRRQPLRRADRRPDRKTRCCPRKEKTHGASPRPCHLPPATCHLTPFPLRPSLLGKSPHPLLKILREEAGAAQLHQLAFDFRVQAAFDRQQLADDAL